MLSIYNRPLAPQCPICADSRTRPFFEKSGRVLLQCVACRHIFWDLVPDAAQLAAYYAKSYTAEKSQRSLQEQNRQYYRGHLKELLALAGEKNSRNVSLIDYGCSVPVLLEEAAQMGFGRAIGVDYAVEEAHGGMEMITPEQVETLRDQSIDIVRFSHTLEHIPDPVAVLERVFTKLRRGGLLYVTQPSFPVFRADAAGFDLKDSVYPEHLHFFSPISLAAMVRKAGFRINRLFTHQGEKEIYEQTRDKLLDLEYARSKMADLKSKGDAAFPEFDNYPYYCGENSVLHAVRPSRWFF